MSDWTSGYVADIGYTYGYYKELNPLRMRLALLNAGIEPPKVSTACELGFGQGLSAAIHASAAVAQWWGNDFLPSQALCAQNLVNASGANAQFTDESFAEFLARDDLPKFDFICLHGVWTWVSNENRQLIMAFIKKNLKVGGVVYVSYNTQVGWAQIMPLRRLLVQHTQRMGAPGEGSAQRIRQALQFADQVLKTQPLHATANSQVAPKLQELLGQDPHYLAHEYFNRDWQPMDFADMAEVMAEAKLDYASSASYLDLIEAINLSAEQQQLLNQIDDVALRENTRDFCVDKKFRKDYWTKGAQSLNPVEVINGLRAERVVMTKPRGAISLVLEGALGIADLAADIYNPILDYLADYQVHTLGEIEQALASHGKIGLQEIVQAMFIFTHRGEIQSAQSDEAIAAVKNRCDKFNQALMAKAHGSASIYFLACPVTGGGIEVARFSQLFLQGYQQGQQTPEALAEFVWTILEPLGEGVMKYGRTLESAEDNLAELTQRASNFINREYPMLKALGIG
ncbi:class I SAM-dependent methyltransferase [Thiomicrospira sp. ALE5]|uniref:class I SAM-dependent methyltransferase n=1 Tax=Thiomicrospira sp. ALE5 TaxID=748650 RepID=UPI0008F06A84|nr:class I SAM-dependent methyltransferase [Thiomicrospira sp. ALE5]SFR53366.1 Predicted methyltransferase regulatory domain-containing protein [Thiomicrospira sp. ALE5]